MELFTAVEKGDLVKTKSLLDNQSSDGKTNMINSSDPSGMTPLHIASREGHLDLVKYLIDLGAEVSKPSHEGDTALHFASRKGHLGVVQCLVTKGSELQTGNTTPLFIASGEGDTPLLIALHNGHYEIAKYFIVEGADPDKADSAGQTPLCIASQKGHLGVVETLVNAGAEVNKASNDGNTPLLAASRKGHQDIVEYLITKRADPNVADSAGQTPLYIASQKGYLCVVKSLVNTGADVNKTTKGGNTPLLAALRMGYHEIAKYLIIERADFNMADRDGQTPLYIVSQKGYLGVVESLVNAGADVNKASSDGDTPLLAALRMGYHEIAKYLITERADFNMADRDGQTPLYIASQEGYLGVVESLVNAGADVNKTSNNGDTPLLAALRIGNLGIVKYLSTRRADPDMTDSSSQTPLCIASQKGHLGVVESLVNAGADANKASKDGDTPLLAALRIGNLDIAKYLVTKGADPDIADSAGKTRLYIALQNGHLGVAESLVNVGADVNKATNDGDTPLFAALRKGYHDIAKYLVTKGADPNVTDSSRQTPLYMASQMGHRDIVESLVNAGADVNKASNDGNTPLLAALRKGHHGIAKYLITERADPDMADSAGQTPLWIASQKGHLGVVESLVNAGADVNKASNDGNAPLLAASRTGNFGIVKYIISNGATLDFVNNKGETSFSIALKEGHLDVAEYLVIAGADVNKAPLVSTASLHAASRLGYINVVQYMIPLSSGVNVRDGGGFTPLHHAAQNGQHGVVKCLLDAGADVNTASSRPTKSQFAAKSAITADIRNVQAFTPLHLASHGGHLNTVEYLVQAGADVNKVSVSDNAPWDTTPHKRYFDHYGTELTQAYIKGITPLHLASQAGHLDIVEYLVQAGADVDKASGSDITPGDTSSHERYFDHYGTKPTKAYIKGITPLHLASQAGRLDIVEYLVQAGADVNKAASGDDAPWDTYHFGYYSGSTKPEWAERGNIEGIPPLHLASYGGHLNIVEYLIQAGADVNKAASGDDSPWDTHHFGYYSGSTKPEGAERGNIEGTTPLHLASFAGHLSIVEYLIQAGAHVNQASVDGNTPVHVALNACLLDKPSYLRRYLEEEVFDVGMYEYFSSVNSTLPEEQYGIRKPFANFERDVEKALSTLQWHAPSNKGYLDIVTYLITKGAEVDRSNIFDVTPLQLASFAGHLGAVECLVNAGADVNKANIPSRLRKYFASGLAHKIPLHIASEEGHLGIVQYLLKSGADVNTTLENGDTPLHAASNKSHVDVVHYLTARGANLNACNKDGITSLHAASLKGNLQVAEYLVEVGADVNMVSSLGEGPLHAASLKGNLEIVQYLVDAGANVNTVSSNGEGPLQAASRMGHHDVVQYLSEVCKNRSTPTGQGGFQRSPASTAFDPDFLDVPTYGSTTSSEKEHMTKPLAETSSARILTSLVSTSDLDKKDDQYHQSRSTDEQPTTEGRDTVNLEKYHIVAKIPTGEQGVNDITIQVIEKAPSDLILKEDQSIIAVGLKFSPPGLQFNSPLKVTLPHSAIFTNPRKANIVLYMRNNDVNIFSEVFPSPEGTPRCVVRQDDLDLYIDHFSEWWIITYLRETFIGKRLMCTPYIPLLRPKNVTQCIIIGLKDDVKGIIENIPDYKAAFPGTQFLVRWRYGKLSITHRVDDKEISKKSMEEREFYYLNNHRIGFWMKLNDPDKLQMRVEFILSQYITKQIMFPLLSEDVGESPLPSPVSPVPYGLETLGRTDLTEEKISPMQSCTDTSQIYTATHSDHESLVDTQEVTEAHLLKLSKLLPPGSFSEVYVAFEISSVTAKSTLAQKMHNYPETYMELLLMWKRRSARTLKELDGVLVKADLGGLRPEYRRL